MTAALLPSNSSPLELAVEQACLLSDNADAVRPLYRPAAVPAPVLPWLAWAFDVPLWPDDPAARRHITADAWRLHRLRGTLAGMREILRYTGADITKAVTPPAKVFASPTLTTAERNDFVARYPQLRIYRHRTSGQRVGLHVGDCHGARPAVQSDALNRILPRAYLWRAGVSAELAITERVVASREATAQSVTVTEVAIPGTAGRLSFVGGHPRHLTATEAARRFYRVTLGQTYIDTAETLRRVTAEPGMTPIDVRPDAIAETGQATGVHAGQFVARHLAPSTARDRLYQRLYLFDADVEVIRRAATLYLNAGRLGMPPHNAELSLRIRGQTLRQAAGRYVRGYLVAQPKKVLADSLYAMRNMARASDRIAVNTRTRRPAAAGESVVAGQLIAGAWVN